MIESFIILAVGMIVGYLIGRIHEGRIVSRYYKRVGDWQNNAQTIINEYKEKLKILNERLESRNWKEIK